jgi:hypothetical protein
VKPISEPILHPTEDNRIRLEGSTGIPACVSESTDKNVCATFLEAELNDRVETLYGLAPEERAMIVAAVPVKGDS